MSLPIICAVFTSNVILASNPPGAKPTKGKDEKEVEVTDATEKAEKFATDYKDEANKIIDSLDIDTSAVEDFLKDLDLGWTANRIKNEAIEIAKNAKDILVKAAKEQSSKFVDQAAKTYTDSTKKINPNAKFQGNYSFFDGCCDEAKWTRVGANVTGTRGAKASGKLDISFRAGGSAGVEVTVPFKVSVTLEIKFDVAKSLNPLAPRSGMGSTLEVEGTPTWDLSVSGSAGGGALIIVTVGGGTTNSDTLKDVKATLDSGCS